MTNEFFSLILTGAAWIRAVLGGSLEISLWFTKPYFVQRNFSLTDGIIFSLGNCWWSPSELANSVLIRGFLFQYPCVSVIPVSKLSCGHLLFTGNTKWRFIANKKCKPLLTQLGNGLFLLLSLSGKKNATIFYLVGYIIIPLNIFYLLLSSFQYCFLSLTWIAIVVMACFLSCRWYGKSVKASTKIIYMSHSAVFPHYSILSRVYVGPANRTIVSCFHLCDSNL